jgi:hypothetical protein
VQLQLNSPPEKIRLLVLQRTERERWFLALTQPLARGEVVFQAIHGSCRPGLAATRSAANRRALTQNGNSSYRRVFPAVSFRTKIKSSCTQLSGGLRLSELRTATRLMRHERKVALPPQRESRQRHEDWHLKYQELSH